MKKIMNMKKTFAAILAAAIAASAALVAENQELLESKVDSANAKRGLEITGSIRAVAQTSRFDTDNDPSGLNNMPNVEKDEFVTADFNFGFRPWENVRANAMIRLGAGMQEYFASASKTMSVAWLNVEGNLGNNFYWVVGDFRQSYSPLTLYLPGIDIMYEPQIFARKRYMAEHEQLIEGNQRNLQGVNLQFRKDLGASLGEVRAEALFARLNRTAILDFSGAEGNILPSDTVWGASQASNMDKFLLAGNFELLPLNKSLYVGVTSMYIFDNEDSYSYTYRHPDNNYDNDYVRQDINPYEPNPQNTVIISGRIGADVANLMGNKDLILNLTGEFAMSNDDVYTPDSVWAVVIDEETGLPTGEFATNDDGNPYLIPSKFKKESETGMAVLVNANIGYNFSEMLNLRLAVDFIYNDSNWFNNLAQSPKFFAQRVLNSDKDGQTVKYGVNSPLYSSFDALYNFSPKFSPVATTLATDDNAFKGSDVNSYNIANYNKNSWGSNIYTRNQLALLETLFDPALQLSLPNGLATANRVGARTNLIFGYGDFAEIQGLFSYFKQVKGLELVNDDHLGNVTTFSYKAAEFMEFGGGAKVDIFKMLGFTKPLEISGSYKHSERSMDTDGWAAQNIPDFTSKVKSDFINAGLYVQYLPRLGFNAGLQYINTEFENSAVPVASAAPLMKGKQMQWMVGLDYNIAPTAWLAINFGMINVENKYNTSALFTADEAGVVSVNETPTPNMPDYYVPDPENPSTSYKHKFSQMILEASINVEF